MKEIAVIGLGKFGMSVAKKYSQMGGNVLAIDSDEDKVQEISDFVTYAVKADMMDQDSVKAIGLSDMDVVVVALTDNMEAAVMAVLLAKEAGVPKVIAKCRNELHETVLRKVGADAVIFPEREMGLKIARRLAVNNLEELVELSDNFCVAEGKIPKSWIGKNLIQLNLRKKYGLNVVGIKKDGKINSFVEPDTPLEEGTIVIVIGEDHVIEKIFQ